MSTDASRHGRASFGRSGVMKGSEKSARSASRNVESIDRSVRPADRRSSDRRLRVALVIDTLHRGGAESIVVKLANHLDPRQVQIVIVQTRTEGPWTAKLAPHVRRHCLNRSTRWDLGAIFRLARFLKEQEIDIVHSHNHSASYFVRLARAVSRGQWIHVVHDHHGPVESSWILPALDRVLLRRVDAYIAVSHALREYGRYRIGVPDGRCLWIPNGIEIPEEGRSRGDASLTVVQVARISPEKNQKMALRVVAGIKHLIPDLNWIFVGRCDGRSGYARQVLRLVSDLGVEENVRFVGEQEDVSSFLRRADVAALTSRDEGLPVALLEAMAHALPLVATDAGACRSILEAAEGGSVVAVDDVAGFVGALTALASNPKLRSVAGNRNRAYVKEEFGIARMSDQICRLYQDLALTSADASGSSFPPP
jgi:glycosyltransferase involved in cell wall biosynthesis